MADKADFDHFHMEKEYDEALVKQYEEAVEKAFRSICEAHPGEHYYSVEVNFNKKGYPWFVTFSKEALQRAFVEQEITDPKQQFWFMHGGRNALSVAYDYYAYLTELNALIDSQKTWHFKLSKKEQMKAKERHHNAAFEALNRLIWKRVIILSSPCSMGVGDEDEHELPVPKGTVMVDIDALLEKALNDEEAYGEAESEDTSGKNDTSSDKE